MNPLHAKQFKLPRSSRTRSGLSIIEVLTSIVVAMIGVFGVMVLIPFAVKQAQVGLDSDAAVALARNANSDFEIQGYRFPTTWAVYNSAMGEEIPYSPFTSWDSSVPRDGARDSPPMAPRIISIDPLGIAENGQADIGDAHDAARFPFNRYDAGSAFPDNELAGTSLRFLPANLGTPAGVTMADFDADGVVDVQGRALARRMFRSSEDLVYGTAVDDLFGPEQIFDQSGTAFLRRQSVGRLSWSAILVPFKDDPSLGNTTRWSYKMYIVVYKDRDPADAEEQMITCGVANTGTSNPISNISLEPAVTAGLEGIDETVESVFKRDDWVMLVNQDTSAEVGFDRQVAFYRVVNSADAFALTSSLATLTLDGPPFIFSETPPSGRFGSTFVVHLKNVVGVYERTFVSEAESNWNISF